MRNGTLISGPALLLLWAGSLDAAVALRIHYDALERILAEQLFTQDGRRYVRGSKADRCNYAFLENPRVQGVNGRVTLKAHFSGRSAAGFFGRCIGLGGDFDVAIVAVPYYRNGAIALRDMKVDSPGRDGFYVRRVRAALGASLSKQFEYRVSEDVKKMLEAPREKSPWRQELSGFQVSDIRITAEALELILDFTLAIK